MSRYDDTPFFFNEDFETDEMIHDLERYEWLEKIMQQDQEPVKDQNNG
jgi:hypothetical protein